MEPPIRRREGRVALSDQGERHRYGWLPPEPDRAMILVTYSRLELTGDVGRIAMPIAREQASALLAEPALKGAPLAPFAAAVTAAYDAAASRQPRAAWRALYLWMRDERLQRYRVPCAACLRGSVGVEGFEGGAAGEESPGA